VRRRRYRYRAGVIAATVWLCIWVIISIALIDIAILEFRSDNSILTLVGWGAAIAVVYLLSLLCLTLARRGPRNAGGTD
jgi:hypothetical protein